MVSRICGGQATGTISVGISTCWIRNEVGSSIVGMLVVMEGVKGRRSGGGADDDDDEEHEDDERRTRPIVETTIEPADSSIKSGSPFGEAAMSKFLQYCQSLLGNEAEDDEVGSIFFFFWFVRRIRKRHTFFFFLFFGLFCLVVQAQ